MKIIKKIIKIIVIIYIVLMGLTLIFGSKSDRHLKRKYNEKFKYVKVLDDGIYHYLTKDGKDIMVACDDECIDNYYSVASRENMINFIGKVLKELNIFDMDYKYYISKFKYCDNKIKLDTPIEEALKIDSFSLFTHITIYISEDEYNNNFENVDKKIQEVFKKYNLLGSISINVIQEDNYNNINNDKRKYIYDYDASTLHDFKREEVYSIMFNDEEYKYYILDHEVIKNSE